MKIQIGNFATGGYYAVMVDGTVIAHSKSYTSAREVAHALAEREAVRSLEGPSRPAYPPGLTVETDPVHLDEALEYEDGIAHWPRYTDVEAPYGGPLGSAWSKELYDAGIRRRVISSRVGPQKIEAVYAWDSVRDPDAEKHVRRNALDKVDRIGREAWDAYTKDRA